MDLIDRNEICNKCPYKGEKTVCSGCRIGNAPEVDAVPVVRCKNCKQSYDNVSGIYCRYHFSDTEPDFYCGDGEPKDGDKE